MKLVPLCVPLHNFLAQAMQADKTKKGKAGVSGEITLFCDHTIFFCDHKSPDGRRIREKQPILKGNAMTGASWAVVMTADEPGLLVEANVRWHLACGAAEVFVYLDQPDDPAAAQLQKIPGCHVQLCTGNYWTDRRRTKGRPAPQMRRQSINANHAQDRCTADWLIHLDADEFLWSERPMDRELAAIRDLDAEFNIPVVERCYLADPATSGLFGGAFRKQSRDKGRFDTQIYGDMSRFLFHGLLAHKAGKCGVPVRQGMRLGVHWAYVDTPKPDTRAPKYVSDSTRLLHFDGLTPLHWAAKFVRYKMNPPDVLRNMISAHRRAQIDWMITATESLDDALGCHRVLQRLEPGTAARLRAFGLLADIPFGAAIAQTCPDLDLTCAAFDAELKARRPDIMDLLDPA